MSKPSLSTSDDDPSVEQASSGSAVVATAVPNAVNETESSTMQTSVTDPSQSIDKSNSSTGTTSSQSKSPANTSSSNSPIRTPDSATSDEGWSASQYSSATSSSESAPKVNQTQPSIKKPDVDLNLPKGVNTRDTPILTLNRRITEISVRPLAEGTYSNVWQGTLDKEQLVAIKCLRDKQVPDDTAQRRLRREAGAWWCLDHENIVPLLGTIKEERFGVSSAMVSPWYENGSAVQYLQPNISMSQRVKLFHGVAKGIQYLHTFDVTKIPAHGNEDSRACDIKLVHGDLKPLNVLVDNDGVAKICDFGLLRLIRASGPTGMTTTSSHSGTTRYLSYELVSEDDDDPKPTTASDIYALACIGMEFIYSKLPHANIPDTAPNTVFKIMSAIEKGKLPAVRPANCTGAVSSLWDLFEACWSRDTIHRPDAAAICQFLEEKGETLVTELEKSVPC